MHRLLPLTVLALAVSCSAYKTTVNGVTVVKFGPEADYERLKDHNERVNAARKNLLKRIGDDPAKERAQIDATAKELAAIRAEITDGMKGQEKAYESFEDNLTDAEKWLAATRAGLASLEALKALEASVLAEPPPSAADIAGVEAKVKAFTGVHKGWANVAEDHARRLEKAQQTIAQGPEIRAKSRAEAQSRADAKAKENARRSAEKAISTSRQLEHQLEKRLKAAEVPSEAEIAALEAAAQAIEAIAPEESGTARRLLLQARITSALTAQDPGPALQAVLEGAVVATGQSKGKKLSVPLKAKAGHCVVWVGRYASFTGSEKLKGDKLKPSGDVMAVQAFSYRAVQNNSGAAAFELYGFCGTRAAAATVTAELEFTGSKNGVRYVALDFEKAAFPKELATRLYLDMPDHCDPEAWAAMWLNPVPGSLAYVKAEPVVVSSGNLFFAGRPGTSSSSYGGVSRSAPAAVKFTHQLEWKECSTEYGDSPTTRAIKACSDRIDKRYEAQWKSIDRTRDVADRMSNSTVKFYSPAAEERAARLREKWDKDYARECQHLEDKAEKAFAKRFEALVDQLTDAKPVDVLFRNAPR